MTTNIQNWLKRASGEEILLLRILRGKTVLSAVDRELDGRSQLKPVYMESPPVTRQQAA